MAASRDYYNVLGVSAKADGDEIKRAYRALALRWHPDRNAGNAEAEARFKDVNEAYRVLSDPEQRARYDRLGPLFTADGRPPRPDEVSEVMSRMWSNLWGRKPRARGEDLRFTVAVSLEEVGSGTHREIVLPRQVRCATCDGVGAPTSGRQTCPICKGTGRSTGGRLLRTSCYHCDGRGYVVTAPCDTCHGDGRTAREDTLKVKIPPGVTTGQKLKVPSKGNETADGGPAGDLYVLVSVPEHTLFRRRGDDLVVDVPITVAEATLGAEIAVPTLDGRTVIRVPPGTPPGRVFRLAGRGLPVMGRSGRGDLHLEVQIEIPVQLSDDDRRGLERWAASLPDSRHPERARFARAVQER